jgi:branched-chain amino acid transport system substrate-binding protein
MTLQRRLHICGVLLMSLVISAAMMVVGEAAQAADNGAPITVGIICSCTGPEASSIIAGPPAYQAWASSVNAHGGIGGHDVKVIVKDDAANPTTSLSEAQSLINQDNAVALVDDSEVDSSWGTYVRQHNVPVIGGASFSYLYVTNSDFFSVGQTPDNYAVNYAEAAKKVGAKTIGEIYCAEAAACQQGATGLKTTSDGLGVQDVFSIAASASAPNYAAQCLAAQQAGVKMLVPGVATTVGESIATDCSKQGYNPYYVVADGGVAVSSATTPGFDHSGTGLVVSEPDLPFWVKSTPGSKTMYKAFKKYKPSLTGSSTFNAEAVQFWDSGLLLAAAVNASAASKSVTSASLVSGLYKLKGTTLGGMAPPLTYHRGVPNPVDCWFWGRVTPKGFTTPYGLKADCAKSPAA